MIEVFKLVAILMTNQFCVLIVNKVWETFLRFSTPLGRRGSHLNGVLRFMLKFISLKVRKF